MSTEVTKHSSLIAKIVQFIILFAILGAIVTMIIAGVRGSAIYNEHVIFNSRAESIKTAILSDVIGTPKKFNYLDIIVSNDAKITYKVELNTEVEVSATTKGLTFANIPSVKDINNSLPEEYKLFKLSHNTVIYSLLISQIFNEYYESLISHVTDLSESEENVDLTLKYINLAPGYEINILKGYTYKDFYSTYIENLELNDDNEVLVKYFTIFDKTSISNNFYTLDFTSIVTK